MRSMLVVLIALFALSVAADAPDVRDFQARASADQRKAIETEVDEMMAGRLAEFKAKNEAKVQKIEKHMAGLVSKKEQLVKRIDNLKSTHAKKTESLVAKQAELAKLKGTVGKKNPDATQKALLVKLRTGEAALRKRVTKAARRVRRAQAKEAAVSTSVKAMENRIAKLKAAMPDEEAQRKKREYAIFKRVYELEKKLTQDRIKDMLKQLEEMLDKEDDEKKRQSLVGKQTQLLKEQQKIKSRVETLQRRREQRAARADAIKALLLKIIQTKTDAKALKKDLLMPIKTAKRQRHKVMADLRTMRKQQESGQEVDLAQIGALRGQIEKLMADQNKATETLGSFEHEQEEKVRTVRLQVFKMKKSDMQIRRTEHQLDLDRHTMLRRELDVKLAKLRKLLGRMGMCPYNRLQVKKRQRVYKRQRKEVMAKIRREKNRIRRLTHKIHTVNRSKKEMELKRLAKVETKLATLKKDLRKTREKIIRLRNKQSVKKSALLEHDVNTERAKEKMLLGRVKRVTKRSKPILDTVDKIRKEVKQMRKKEYEEVSKEVVELKTNLKRNKRRIAQTEEDVKKLTRPAAQTKLLRASQKYHKAVESAEKKLESLQLKLSEAKNKYELEVKKEMDRFYANKSALEANREWNMSELKGLALRIKSVKKQLKGLTKEADMAAIMDEIAEIRAEAKERQITVYKITEKLKAVALKIRKHAQQKALHRYAKVFRTQEAKFKALSDKKKALEGQIKKLLNKIKKLNIRVPYVEGDEKYTLQAKIRRLEESIGFRRAKVEQLQMRNRKYMKRVVSYGKEYTGLVDERMKDLRGARKALAVERPNVHKATLYSLDYEKQKAAEKRLIVIDHAIDSTEHELLKLQQKRKATAKAVSIMEEKLKFKGNKCRVLTGCKICKKLGRIAKYGLRAYEDDRVILERLRNKCRTLPGDSQRSCYKQAVKIAKKALHTFDPMKFHTETVCNEIRACGN